MPGQWPPKDLFLEDNFRAPLVSPFATGSGVSTFLELTDTPSAFSGKAGQFPKVNAGETALEFGSAGGFAPEHIFYVTTGGELTSFDDVAYTDIQTALDAANALTPSMTNQYVIMIGEGTYDVGFLTVYDYVHLVGMDGFAGIGIDSGGRGGVRIGLGRTVGQGAGSTLTTLSNENITFKNLSFYANGQTTQTNGIDSGARTIRWVDCTFNLGTGNTNDMEAWAGDFINCLWEQVELNVLGSNALALNFYNNRFGESAEITAGANTAGYFYGCYIEDTSGAHGVNVSSDDVIWHACNFQSLANNNAAAFTFEGKAIGCTFNMSQNPSLASQTVSLIKTAGGAQWIGNKFIFSGDDGNSGTEGCFEITDLAAGDIVFTGNHFDRESSGHSLAFIMFGSGITATDHKAVFTGNTFNDEDEGGGLIFQIHSSGFAGNLVVHLDGNTYISHGQTSMPTNSGAGRVIWTGSDIRAEMIRPAWGIGTGTLSNQDNFPAVLLDAGTETCFLSGRGNPPAGVLIDASIILSANNSDGITGPLAFTDTDGTALATHDSNWTVQSGTITIQSNKADATSVTATSIATHAVTASNGWLRATDLVAGSGSGTQEAGLLFRWADASNYWRLTVSDDDGFQLIKRVAGSNTVVWDDTTATQDVAVSFNGDVIRVYEDYDGTPRLVAEIIDSDLEGNTSVGMYFTGLSGRTKSLDNWEWHPGGDVDLTIETDHAHMHEPWADANVASANDDGVDVMHKAYSRHDVAFGIGEDLSQVKVTLDVLNGNITQVYVHGMVVRYLPIHNGADEGWLSDDHTPVQGIMTR